MRPSNNKSIAFGALLIGSAGTVYLLRRLIDRRRRHRRSVVITGGCGNLGIKLANHLLSINNSNSSDNEYNVILLEHPDYFVQDRVPPGARVILGDLKDGSGLWTNSFCGVDTVVHFSSVNPYPNATWEESAESMSHNFNVFLAATKHKVRRVIMASSNHVMGGYKDVPDFGMVKPSSPPYCGTFLRDAEQLAKSGDAVAYAAAKLAGEQLCRALGTTTTATTFCVLRIGWCQPGDNSPRTLSAAGVPPEYETKVVNDNAKDSQPIEVDEHAALDENWFKNMWLSNRDFLNLFTAAINVDLPKGAKHVVLNAMSNNKGSRWSLSETKNTLGVMPEDDSSIGG